MFLHRRAQSPPLWAWGVNLWPPLSSAPPWWPGGPLPSWRYTQRCVDETPAAMKVNLDLKCCNTFRIELFAPPSATSDPTFYLGRLVCACVYACVCVCVSSGGLFEAPLMVSLVLSGKRLSARWMSSSRCCRGSAGCVCACAPLPILYVWIERSTGDGGRGGVFQLETGKLLM